MNREKYREGISYLSIGGLKTEEYILNRNIKEEFQELPNYIVHSDVLANICTQINKKYIHLGIVKETQLKRLLINK